MCFEPLEIFEWRSTWYECLSSIALWMKCKFWRKTVILAYCRKSIWHRPKKLCKGAELCLEKLNPHTRCIHPSPPFRGNVWCCNILSASVWLPSQRAHWNSMAQLPIPLIGIKKVFTLYSNHFRALTMDYEEALVLAELQGQFPGKCLPIILEATGENAAASFWVLSEVCI